MIQLHTRDDLTVVLAGKTGAQVDLCLAVSTGEAR